MINISENSEDDYFIHTSKKSHPACLNHQMETNHLCRWQLYDLITPVGFTAALHVKDKGNDVFADYTFMQVQAVEIYRVSPYLTQQ